MSIRLVDKEVQSGEKRWVELQVAEDADMSELTVRACVVNGGEGPTLWAQGCLHGSEHVGGLALRDALLELSPDDVSGSVIGVPVANPPAFAGKQRLSTIDGSDVNRSFRGSPSGTFSEMLAHTLFSAAERTADYYIDLHNGGNEYIVPGFAIFSRTGDDAEEEARTMCEAAGLPYSVGIDREFGGSMGTELADAGIPGAVIEAGGRGHVSTEYYEENRRAIDNIGKQIGILEGDLRGPTGTQFFDELEWLRAQTGGFFETAVEANSVVDEGAEIARITDIEGETKEVFEAPYDAVVLCLRTYGVARPGDWVIEVAPLAD